MITVENILDLMLDATEVCIFVDGNTFKFPINELPEELLYMEVQSIDDPFYQEINSPITLNIDEGDFDDLNAFVTEFREYLE